jgi:twinkle protein
MNVLWGSFEIKNTRLVHKLMKQYSREALPDIKGPNAVEELDALADRFQELPLHFLRFHGGSDIDEVLDAMEYAVYVNDSEHIILDNMQFMISRGSTASGGSFEKFDIQDVAIEKFRKFATQHNVHLTLVVHPRKEDETAKLNISSFYGSAKATQEADTVLILQHDGRRKYVEVKKNRFDGTLGYSPLFFESKSGRYVETEGGAMTAKGGGGGTPAPSSSSSSSGGSTPAPIAPFIPQHQTKSKWVKKEPEPDPEGLDDHWATMLTPQADTDEEDRC